MKIREADEALEKAIQVRIEAGNKEAVECLRDLDKDA